MKIPPEAMKYFQTTGAQGGKKRAQKLTKEQRRAIAQKAARARWDKEKK